METRIIDLIKNPETLRVEDLNLLETEIEKFPYMQGLRAIYLLGVHRFYNENFSKSARINNKKPIRIKLNWFSIKYIYESASKILFLKKSIL